MQKNLQIGLCMSLSSASKHNGRIIFPHSVSVPVCIFMADQWHVCYYSIHVIQRIPRILRLFRNGCHITFDISNTISGLVKWFDFAGYFVQLRNNIRKIRVSIPSKILITTLFHWTLDHFSRGACYQPGSKSMVRVSSRPTPTPIPPPRRSTEAADYGASSRGFGPTTRR
jgi:hypothetical protein